MSVRHYCLLLMLFALTAFSAEHEFSFSGQGDGVRLSPGCHTLDGRFFAENKTLGATVANSENWHLGEDGFTVAATINLKRRYPNFGNGYGPDGGFLYDHDIIASKGTEFVFGRRGDFWCDQLYLNFKCNGKWAVPLVGTVGMPPYGTYAHVAVVVKRSVVDFRGFDGYVATYYVNGEPEKEQQINCGGPADMVDASWTLGSGLGVRDDVWSFGGEMTDVFLCQEALSEAQIMKLAINSAPARVAKSAGAELSEGFVALTAKSQENASNFGKWAIDGLTTNAGNGAPQDKIAEEIKRVSGALSISEVEKFAQQWNKSAQATHVFFDGRSLLLVAVGEQQGGYPIFGWYDVKNQRELLGRTPPGWSLKSHLAGMRQNVMQNSAGTGFSVALNAQENGGTITWLSPDKLTVTFSL